jgi:hypothetical protein
MRSKYVVLSTIAAGSLAVTGIGVGTSVAASSAAKPPKPITFKAKTVLSHEVGKSGKIIEAQKNVSHGKFIGTSSLTFVVGNNNLAKAKVAAAFKGGFVYGRFTASGDGTLSNGKITGGTGEYKDATGTITGEGAGKAERVTLTFN